MKNFKEILNDSPLKAFSDKGKQLAKLNAIWKLFRPNLANHCQIANFEEGKLVFEIYTPSFAMRIRFELPEIKNYLIKFDEFSTLESIRYQIIIPVVIRSSLIRQKKSLSPYSANLIAETAASIENASLKAALMKLAGNKN